MSGWFADERNFQMRGIAYFGRILKTGILVLQYELIGQTSDSKSAHPGQAPCPILNQNRSLGLAWILLFRRVDFVWL
ncbi:hypothetical protein ST45_08255 [Prevotella pectinovora]|nr:hypothetical protein ST45_08255 [Prevotella pectinovora]